MGVWRSSQLCDHQIKFNISYLHNYTYADPPNLNLPIFLQSCFRAQMPPLIPANFSSYTVCLRNYNNYNNDIILFDGHGQFPHSAIQSLLGNHTSCTVHPPQSDYHGSPLQDILTIPCLLQILPHYSS